MHNCKVDLDVLDFNAAHFRDFMVFDFSAAHSRDFLVAVFSEASRLPTRLSLANLEELEQSGPSYDYMGRPFLNT